MGALDCVSASKISPTDSTEVFAVDRSDTSLDKTKRDIESQLLQYKTNSRRHGIWWTLGVDVPLLSIVATLLGLQQLGMLPQHKSGFFCNDPALSYPYLGDTISMAVIICSIIACPLFLILITELVFTDAEQSTRLKLVHSSKKALWLYRSYAYGLLFNVSIIEVMKAVSGNPRPTFFDICEPDTAKTCNGSDFVSTFSCTSTRFSAWYQMDSYHSFPSGHTSLSVYCGLFMAWYLQRRAFDWSHRSVFLVPVLQLICVTYAVVCSLTRISDHRHHWWDVLTGAVVGIICLVYTVIVLCDNFSYAEKVNTEDINMTTSQQTTRTTI
ncbi:unnamed protein product [Parnassius mnemosyne]|uniref:Phosphatidic acid phosphatase type 2/haloperoxidase domain-containing protein n=1 Tax=Parnassius mnemosyne TaxID=213953 RepID=A0AAV1KR01_9NEOP